ncbi:MAG: DUF86 domain-containing protein [Atribacterota bacterium]|nr:DUF86 domain-containing protein [Atribacterota bacterium]
MSEATQLLPNEAQNAHPEIPWKLISGCRDILVHNYLVEIGPQTVATMIADHLPPLEPCAQAMLAQAAE